MAETKIIEVGDAKYFINEDNFWRKLPPTDRDYRIFRRHKIIKLEENAAETQTDELQYGLGEFFYDKDGNIVSYDDSPIDLSGLPIDELILEIEGIYQATKKGMYLIDKVTEKGIKVAIESRKDVISRLAEERRKKERENKRKGNI